MGDREDEALAEALRTGEIMQVLVEWDDGSLGWVVIDPKRMTYTLHDEPTPGIRTHPPDNAN